MSHSFAEALAQGDGDSVLIEEINHSHQKFAVVNLVLDSQGAHGVTVEDVDYVWILHISFVKLS